MQVKKIPTQYRHSYLEFMFQCFGNLLVKFYYKIKQRAPTPPAFVNIIQKKVEIIQKKSDFPVLCLMVYPFNLSMPLI